MGETPWHRFYSSKFPAVVMVIKAGVFLCYMHMKKAFALSWNADRLSKLNFTKFSLDFWLANFSYMQPCAALIAKHFEPLLNLLLWSPNFRSCHEFIQQSVYLHSYQILTVLTYITFMSNLCFVLNVNA